MTPRGEALSRWVLSCAVTSMLTHAAAEGSGLSLAAAAATAGLWAVTGGSRPMLPSRWLVNALLLGVVLFCLHRAATAGIDIELFSMFLVLMLVTKSLDRRRVRDLAQIVSLSLFLGLASVLTNNGLATAAGVMVLAGLLLSTTLRLQLAAAAERSVERTDEAAADEAALRKDLRGLWSSVGVLALLVSAAVFVVMPRGLGVSAFGAWGTPAIGQVSGFSDEITLGSGGLITPSAEPVLDLRVTDTNGVSLGDAGKRYYLRGAVLEEYADGAWTRRAAAEGRRGEALRSLRAMEQTAQHTLQGGLDAAAFVTRQEYTLRAVPPRESTLFTIWAPARFTSERPVLLIEGVGTRTLSVGRVSGRFSYTIESHEQPATRARAADEPGRADPSGIPAAVGAYAAEVVRSAGVELVEGVVPVAQRSRALTRVEASFDDGRYAYTLETLAAPAGRDPVEWFLLESREGHCEYYAAAMAAMCRAVGIDARVVTGFVASEYSAGTDHYIVRASDAHAWVEAEVAPGVWGTFDPTPTAEFRRIHDPERTLAAALRRLYDAVEFAWIQHVVAFDGAKRARLFGLPGDDAATLGDAVLRRFDRVRRAEPARIVRSAVLGLGTTVAVYGAGALVLGRWGRIRPAIARAWGATLGRVLGWLWRRRDATRLRRSVHRELLAALEAGGFAKPVSIPLNAHLASCGVLERVSVESAAALSGAGRSLYAWTYGREEPGPAEVELALRSVRAAAAEVRRAGRRGG